MAGKDDGLPPPAQVGESAAAVPGILMMLVAMTVIPVMDASAKYLSDHIGTLQLVWARYTFHLLILLPFVVYRYGRRTFRSERPGFQILRGGMLFTSTGLFFAAISLMPLADAIATVFIYPFIITALSPAVLGERVGIRRWIAVAVGFVGAVIVIRPAGDVVNPGVLLAAAAGAVYAFYVLSTRKLAGVDPPLVTLAFTGLVGALAASVTLPFVWVTPAAADWPFMLIMGLCAAIGHFFLISAHERTKASILAPFGYFEIVMATVLGFAIFGDFPDGLTWLGIAVIVASGIYISIRERTRRRPPAEASEPSQRL